MLSIAEIWEMRLALIKLEQTDSTENLQVSFIHCSFNAFSLQRKLVDCFSSFFKLLFFVWLSNIKHVTPALMAINECQIKARSALKAQSSNKRNGSSNVLFFFVHEPIINNYKSLIYYRKVFLYLCSCAWVWLGLIFYLVCVCFISQMLLALICKWMFFYIALLYYL